MFVLILTVFFSLLFSCPSEAQVLVFTGTFDPPHAGHREILDQAIERVSPKYIFVNPGPTDHKPEARPLAVRMEMTRDLFLKDSRIDFPPLEVAQAFWKKEDDRAMQRLGELFPGEELYRVVGIDRLEWETAESIREAPYKFLVSTRSQDINLPPEVQELLGERVLFLPEPELKISSTLMRRQFTQGVRPTEVSPSVFKIFMDYTRGPIVFCSWIFK